MNSDRSSAALIIRAATLVDVPAIRDVLLETWHATYDGIFGVEQVNAITNSWHSLTAIERLVGFGPASLMLAERSDEIIATATATERSSGTVSLDRLYVRPRAQGAGAGTGLMRASLAPFTHAEEVIVEVEPQNIPAVAFYTRQGFVLSHRVSDCGRAGSGISADVYKRSLPI